jgi:hypothetical protein
MATAGGSFKNSRTTSATSRLMPILEVRDCTQDDFIQKLPKGFAR